MKNDYFQHLGSVVTNNGYSDWANYGKLMQRLNLCGIVSVDVKMIIALNVLRMEYGLSKMRICHMWAGAGKNQNLEIYACSPEDSSFKSGIYSI